MYRKSKPDDSRAIYDLICEMECKELPFDSFSEIYTAQANDDHYYCLVCEHEEKVIGVLNIRFEEQLHHAALVAEIMEFAVDPHYRGRGVGKEMLERACRLSAEFGCTQIEAACNQLRENTHRFYLREGMHNFHFKFSKSLIRSETWEKA